MLPLTKIWLCYGIFSAILMIFMIVLLSVSKHFTNSFYRVITMDIILNLLCWVNTWPSRMVFREDGFGFARFLYEFYNKSFDVSFFLSNVFFHVQSASTICICCHRLSTAIFDNSNRFWSRFYLLVYALIILYSFLAVQLLYRAPIKFDYELNKFYSEPATLVRF